MMYQKLFGGTHKVKHERRDEVVGGTYRGHHQGHARGYTGGRGERGKIRKKQSGGGMERDEKKKKKKVPTYRWDPILGRKLFFIRGVPLSGVPPPPSPFPRPPGFPPFFFGEPWVGGGGEGEGLSKMYIVCEREREVFPE